MTVCVDAAMGTEIYTARRHERAAVAVVGLVLARHGA